MAGRPILPILKRKNSRPDPKGLSRRYAMEWDELLRV
jgi:hypothetical protein